MSVQTKFSHKHSLKCMSNSKENCNLDVRNKSVQGFWYVIKQITNS